MAAYALRCAPLLLAIIGAACESTCLVHALPPQFERIQLSDTFYSEGGTFGDFNADGAGDVAIGPWIYFGPDFQARAQFYSGDAVDPVGYSENFLMYSDDVNADGKPDILVLGFPGKASWWYENPGFPEEHATSSDLWKQHVILDSVDNESPMIVDADGDGVRDLVCCNQGRIVIASHAGQDPTKPWAVRAVTPDNGYQRFTHGLGIGDVNNDGLLDLIENSGWWENPGTSQPADKLWTQHLYAFADAGAQMIAVDFDGDGRNEVLSSQHAHGFGLNYFKATNAAATNFEKVAIMTDSPDSSPTGIAFSQLHGVEVADINGDGVMDIVTGKRWWAHKNGDAGSEQPAVLVWFETQRQSGRVRFVPHTIDISSGIGTQITTGDVNGDGLVDIVSGNKRGAYLFLQRPSNLAANKPLVPGLAASDVYDQKLAADKNETPGGILLALGDRSLNFGFETGDLTDWEIRGPIGPDAVSRNAESSNSPGKAFRLSTQAANGPKGLGEVISRPFLIPAKTCKMQAGGKTDARTTVQLVLQASGKTIAAWPTKDASTDSDAFESIQWDVGQYVGQAARIRVVDHSETAFIEIDAIHFQ